MDERLTNDEASNRTRLQKKPQPPQAGVYTKSHGDILGRSRQFAELI
jgi:hypothetical protein